MMERRVIGKIVIVVTYLLLLSGITSEVMAQSDKVRVMSRDSLIQVSVDLSVSQYGDTGLPETFTLLFRNHSSEDEYTLWIRKDRSEILIPVVISLEPEVLTSVDLPEQRVSTDFDDAFDVVELGVLEILSVQASVKSVVDDLDISGLDLVRVSVLGSIPVTLLSESNDKQYPTNYLQIRHKMGEVQLTH